jgi:hypothetical protein
LGSARLLHRTIVLGIRLRKPPHPTVTKIFFKGGPAMIPKRNDKPSSEESVESDVALKSEQDRSTSPVSTRVGRNTVDIDVPALRHLVDTVKTKLKP